MQKASVLFIFITIVLDMLAMGVIIPVLPKFIEGFLNGDTSKAAEMIGVFGTVWALMQFFFSPILGVLSDKVGRRPVILISNFGLGPDNLFAAVRLLHQAGTRSNSGRPILYRCVPAYRLHPDLAEASTGF